MRYFRELPNGSEFTHQGHECVKRGETTFSYIGCSDPHQIDPMTLVEVTARPSKSRFPTPAELLPATLQLLAALSE